MKVILIIQHQISHSHSTPFRNNLMPCIIIYENNGGSGFTNHKNKNHQIKLCLLSLISFLCLDRRGIETTEYISEILKNP